MLVVKRDVSIVTSGLFSHLLDHTSQRSSRVSATGEPEDVDLVAGSVGERIGVG